MGAVAAAVTGSDVVVFAAGAGPGSGAARKLTMDRDGAIKLLDAANEANVPRYLMISALGASNPPAGDEVFSVYLRAKAEADAAVMASDRDWTILRPGTLTNDPGTGLVRIATAPFDGQIPRADVALVLDELVHAGRASRRVLYLNGGREPVGDAIAAVSEHAG